MKHLASPIILFIAGILILLGCREVTESSVDPAFAPYLQRFVEEGHKREYIVDLSNSGLIIQFGDSVDDGSSHACVGDRVILIEEKNWLALDDFEREALIFHALGHCELQRDHTNAKLPNGEWASLMRNAPFDHCDNAVLNIAGSRRDYYLDELFDPGVDIPTWSTRTSDLRVPANEEVYFDGLLSQGFDINFDRLSEGNFQLDVEFSTDNMTGFGGIQFMGGSLYDNIRITTNRHRDISIDSGDGVWGLMFLQEKSSHLTEGFNRITVQRTADHYDVFVNGEFLYWFDYVQPLTDNLSSINKGTAGEPAFRRISASRLP
ncbi:MAG: hypothetical protein AAF587_13745 [Bacteroidota bacterium]